MFESGIETTIIFTAIVLCLYLNERLKLVHEKLDRTLEVFDGLRDYLYEIDPQFDDERKSRKAFNNDESMFAGMNDMELIRKKRKPESELLLLHSFDERAAQRSSGTAQKRGAPQLYVRPLSASMYSTI